MPDKGAVMVVINCGTATFIAKNAHVLPLLPLFRLSAAICFTSECAKTVPEQ